MKGTLETLLFGKWVRCILGMVMHRRLMLTEGACREQRTQLRHVLPDALVTVTLVPVTVATVMSVSSACGLNLLVYEAFTVCE